jgi:low affinity Fe/Cu permease
MRLEVFAVMWLEIFVLAASIGLYEVSERWPL